MRTTIRSQSLDNETNPLRLASRRAPPRWHYPNRTSGLITIRRRSGPAHEAVSLINSTCVESSRYLTRPSRPNQGLPIKRRLLRHPRPPLTLASPPPCNPKPRTISQSPNRPRITKDKLGTYVKTSLRTLRTLRTPRDPKSPHSSSILTICIRMITTIPLLPIFNLICSRLVTVLKPPFRLHLTNHSSFTFPPCTFRFRRVRPRTTQERWFTLPVPVQPRP